MITGPYDDEIEALINLDQFKAFDRVDHRYLAANLLPAEFEPNLD